ncbi:MAG: hypothetical protein JGK17_30225 [Microcoleus sp. PH2017_10_PVI_O_A]|nr:MULTISPECIES: hypothetical protein [unclassified Microcoleus]MCC3409752.1 hypothetical protein [Microcoleus sp. PH2017_10_PVI_O_A]MCC3464053.1 hypothetical protein [Microcoleus sp. PH2017_11_PCY_U_A]MCC3482355.1 hypothetical protein [Microcoleus sp. PH2017_12_PCY_D_A]MCC3531907.1 hypothetical protein [Microcoleus sp. PH2017_21_RUC_O_A]MCC3544219.1 hypothetical protein [Microcoleus sp. PH2017_22_RUC_O_B]
MDILLTVVENSSVSGKIEARTCKSKLPLGRSLATGSEKPVQGSIDKFD